MFRFDTNRYNDSCSYNETKVQNDFPTRHFTHVKRILRYLLLIYDTSLLKYNVTSIKYLETTIIT